MREGAAEAVGETELARLRLEVIALLHAGDAHGGEGRMRSRGIGDASLYDGLALRLHGARVVPTKRV